MKLNLTEEQRLRSGRNRKKAYRYFVWKGLIPWDTDEVYDLHHKDPTWKYTDIERYISWDINDVEPILHRDHIKISNTGRTVSKETREKISATVREKLKQNPDMYKKSEETKVNMSKSRKNYIDEHPDCMSGENNPFYGKAHSEDTRKRISNSLKGNIPWNKGLKK